MLPNFRQTYSSQIELSKPFAAKPTSENLVARFGLTKKAEPPPTRGVNRDSGTDHANGGWLRRLVRPRNRESHDKIKQIPTLANRQAPHLLAARIGVS
jgi:hypothetical protein